MTVCRPRGVDSFDAETRFDDIIVEHIRDRVSIRRQMMSLLNAEARAADWKEQVFVYEIVDANWRILFNLKEQCHP